MKKDYDFLAAPLAALRAGEIGRAIQMLTELQMVKPELSDTVYHLGRAHQAAGDAVAARAAFLEVAANANHVFYSHALARLTELGPGPSVVVEVVEVVEVSAPAPAAETTPTETNAGVVPPEILAEASGTAPVEATPVETAPKEEVVAPPAPTGKKGKKGKGEPSAGSAGETEPA